MTGSQGENPVAKMEQNHLVPQVPQISLKIPAIDKTSLGNLILLNLTKQ
jgi:hypothetical protein